MWTLIWLSALLFGGDNLEDTDRLAPPGWKGNAWGPHATKLRAEGKIPPIELTPTMKKWDDWGRKTLQSGDIVFRLGDAKIMRGYFPMSRFLANVSGTVFSHTGIASFEDGQLWIYDTTSLSVRRQPLYVWVMDNIGPVGVKRVKPQYAPYAAKAVAYCQEMFHKQVPFDYSLKPDDNELYCVEMSEKAYRNNGLPLAPPVKLGDMENVSVFPMCILGFLQFTDLTLELPVYFPGNDRHGIWSSPALETVYAPPGGVQARIKTGFFKPWLNPYDEPLPPGVKQRPATTTTGSAAVDNVPEVPARAASAVNQPSASPMPPERDTETTASSAAPQRRP